MRARKLRTKLLLPVLGCLALAGILGFLAVDLSFEHLSRQQLQTATHLSQQAVATAIDNKIKEVYSNIDLLGRKALGEVAPFSRMPEVQEAYALALSGNIEDETDPKVQRAREMLRRTFAPLLDGYRSHTGERLQLHFHLPNARSLARLWRDGWQVEREGKKLDISDDISAFRVTVVEINRGDHRPITGIEVGQGGFEIRGLVPVTGKDGKHLGSAETLVPFDFLLKSVKSTDEMEIALYLNAEFLKIGTRFRDAAKHPVLEGRHVFLQSTNPEITNPLVTADLLDRGSQEAFSRATDRYQVAAFPIRDYSGRQAGTMVLTLDLAAQQEMIAQIAAESSSALAGLNRQMAVGMGVLLLALSGLLIWLTTGLLSRPLRQAVEATERIALGELQVEKHESSSFEIDKLMHSFDLMAASLRGKAAMAGRIARGDLSMEVVLASEQDLLGRALLEMTENLNGLLHQVQASVVQMASGSDHVAQGSQALSQGATEQASSLEEITSALTQMASQTRQNAESATLADRMSSEAHKAAERGGEQMEAMLSAMGEISEAGQSISKIIKTIDEIAFQTNLLALNAAVEAARAGAHGKGFAVVAEEVRNLAARSAQAARETAELIEGAVRKTENGRQIAGKTGESLREILAGVGKVADLVAEIAAASNEQAQGIAQVNQGLSQIDQITQQNTASAEESAAAAEELSKQAENLERLMSRFQLRQGE